MDTRLSIKSYNRKAALDYAQIWSFKRNPKYYDFSAIGGDCTNFISQCIFEGCHTMNHTKDVGWYYYSPSQRSASWSGVSFFHRFMVNNTGVGPFAEEVSAPTLLLPGDVIQLGNQGKGWHHTLLVLQTGERYEDVLIATHTIDSYNRALSTYQFSMIRFLHIAGIRTW